MTFRWIILRFVVLCPLLVQDSGVRGDLSILLRGVVGERGLNAILRDEKKFLLRRGLCDEYLAILLRVLQDSNNLVDGASEDLFQTLGPCGFFMLSELLLYEPLFLFKFLEFVEYAVTLLVVVEGILVGLQEILMKLYVLGMLLCLNEGVDDLLHHRMVLLVHVDLVVVVLADILVQYVVPE